MGGVMLGSVSVTRRVFAVLAVLAALVGQSVLSGPVALATQTGIVFDSSPGTGAPPSTLGSATMTPFSPDSQPSGLVTSVAGPTGQVSFAEPMNHTMIGQQWATWSNGYAGDVYTTNGATTAALTLPAGTQAFYFYAEPDPFATFSITATAQDGSTSGPIAVDGYAGARYFGFYSTGSTPLASITVSSAVDFAIGEFGVSTGASPLRYVALGDSYSSGEGNPPFMAGTDGGTDYCHRSDQAYSQVLGKQLSTAPLFYACSGAVTSNITSTFHDSEQPQLLDSGVDPSAGLVTMTIGGNDAQFGPTLQACVSQTIKANSVNNAAASQLAGQVSLWLGLGEDPSCADSDAFTTTVNNQIDNVFGPVKSTYQQLLNTVDPVKTSVMVAGYPKLFSTQASEQGCLQLSSILTPADQDFLNGAADRLDGVLANAAGQSGVNFVDVQPAFSGHGICASGGSYMNALSIASGNGGSCTWSVGGQCIIGGLPLVGSFHPNAAGHSGGYAKAFSDYIQNASNRTSSGMPANPDPLPDPPATHVASADSLTRLTVTPSTPAGLQCEGTLQAGQKVEVRADGFAPGATVRAVVSSPGLGKTNDQTVGTFTADASGAVSGELTVPLAASGYTWAGASAGVAFIDLLGAGSDQSHRDATAITGLAPHASACGSVSPLSWSGFTAPVANTPALNAVQAGQSVPVKFSINGAGATLQDVLATGYPQSAPVSCTTPDLTLTTGNQTAAADSGTGRHTDNFSYVWKTDPGSTGCRELILKLVDGSYHRALFQFRP